MCQRLAPGMYKIVHRTSATLARNFPGAGPRGPWTTSITMTGDVSSNYQTVRFSHRRLFKAQVLNIPYNSGKSWPLRKGIKFKTTARKTLLSRMVTRSVN